MFISHKTRSRQLKMQHLVQLDLSYTFMVDFVDGHVSNQIILPKIKKKL